MSWVVQRRRKSTPSTARLIKMATNTRRGSTVPAVTDNGSAFKLASRPPCHALPSSRTRMVPSATGR